MSFFSVLNKCSQLVFEQGFRAGYKSKIQDDTRTTRCIYSFEAVLPLSDEETLLNYRRLLSAERAKHRTALETVRVLAIAGNKRASEKYAVNALLELAEEEADDARD